MGYFLPPKNVRKLYSFLKFPGGNGNLEQFPNGTLA